MKNFVLLILLILLYPGYSYSSPIPGEELFRSSLNYSYKLNPDSSVIARHYFLGENRTVIELIDVDSEKRTNLFRIKVKQYAYIKEYSWVDRDTLYISYRLGKKDNRKIFLDVDLVKFKTNGEKKTRIRKIKQKGAILDSLPFDNDVVLFQSTKNKNVNVYKASTEILVDGELSERHKIPNHLEAAKFYVSDNKGGVRYALTYDDGDLIFWYFSDEDKRWIEFFSSDWFEDDFDFLPVGKLSGDKVAVITNRDSNTKILVEYDVRNKVFGKTLFEHPKYDLVSAELSKTEGKVKSVSYYDHGRFTTNYLEGLSTSLTGLVNTTWPDKQFVVVSENDNSPIKVLNVFSGDDPGVAYVVNLEQESVRKLDEYYPDMSSYKLSKTENISVKREGEHTIEAIITKPEKGNGVLLVVPHGGPVGVRDIDLFSRSNQYFASRGYTVLSVNFRGSSGFGKDFLNDGRGEFGKKIEEDITSVVSHIKEKNDFKYTCAMGSSYGGYSSLILSIFHPDSYDCIVSSFGVYDLPLLFNTSNIRAQEEYKKHLTKVVGEYNQTLEDYSPFFMAEKINLPVLLIAGRKDDIAGFEQSNRMNYRLKQLNKEVESLYYMRSGHGHTSWNWDHHQHAVMEEFIRRKLNLPLKESKEHKEIYGNEAMLIADSFEFEDQVENDSERALRFYQLAAKLDVPRGLYNLGSFYNRGVNVDRDMMKAIGFYKRASKLGYEFASFRLGEIYREGKKVDIDHKQANHYFSKSMEQGHEKAEFELNRAECLGWGVVRNLEVCLNKLRELEFKENKDHIHLVINDILFLGLNKPGERKLFNLFLSELGYENLSNVGELQIIDSGSYYKRPGFTYYNHADSADNILVNKSKAIGVTFSIKDEILDDEKYAILKVTWETPELFDDANYLTKSKFESFVLAHKAGQFRARMLFEHDWKHQAGDWKLKITTLDNRILYQKIFRVETGKKVADKLPD